ncbi:restriction endonuclease subunit S [Psychrobacillus psychrotolerans]|uniref:restriction endonuclease subunit S n=1 Tax=Psychrobacillus psychrotolerans TaxID=126156 RepID=UPI003C755318
MGNKQMPDIRFAGFTDAWEQRKLDSISDRVKSYSLSRDVETIEDTGYKYIHYGDIHTKVAVVIDEFSNLPNIKARNYDLLEKGDLVVADASEDYQGIATPAVITVDTPYKLVAGLHTIALRPKQVDSLFLYYMFNSPTFRRYGYKTGTGMKVFGISVSNLLKFEGMFPLLEEQTKIAIILKQLDDTIALHQRKLELLKDTKKSLLQKMFPKDGVNVPEIRFPGFTDAWEQRRFEKVFDIHTDFVSNGSFQALKDNVKLYHTENYAYMIRLQDASNNWKGPWLYTDKKGFKFLDKSTVYENDILMSDRGTIGKFFLVPKLGKPMTLSSNAVLLRSSKNDNYFIYYLLNSKEVGNQIKMRTTPGVQPMISKTEFKQITAKFPRLNEQIKIGSFFKQLDDTITLHQRELEALKETKKAFLQKMFV